MREASNGDQVAQLGPAVMLGQALDDVLQGGTVQRLVGLMVTAQDETAMTCSVRVTGMRGKLMQKQPVPAPCGVSSD